MKATTLLAIAIAATVLASSGAYANAQHRVCRDPSYTVAITALSRFSEAAKEAVVLYNSQPRDGKALDDAIAAANSEDVKAVAAEKEAIKKCPWLGMPGGEFETVNSVYTRDPPCDSPGRKINSGQCEDDQ